MTGHEPPPVADVSVRRASPADVDAMAAVTLAAWRGPYAAVLPAQALDGVTSDGIADEWRVAVSGEAGPRHSVFVALEGATLVGYVVVAPSGDPDAESMEATGEVVDLVVDAEHQRRGHGSRLLAAAVDHQRGSGATHLVTWCVAADDPRRSFLAAAGLEPDGATRTLGVDDVTAGVNQVRYAAGLSSRE